MCVRVIFSSMLGMRVYVYIDLWICACICIYIHIYIYTCADVRMCLHIHRTNTRHVHVYTYGIMDGSIYMYLLIYWQFGRLVDIARKASWNLAGVGPIHWKPANIDPGSLISGTTRESNLAGS